jgi:hypothetical protein
VTILVPPRRRVWQGDVFVKVPWSFAKRLAFVSSSNGRDYQACEPPPDGGRGWLVTQAGVDLGALLTHECVFDKPDGYPLTFARVMPLSRERSERLRDQIRQGQQRASFYLPDQGYLAEDSYIDFRFTTVLPAAHVRELRKIASLTREARFALRESIARFWTRPGDDREDEEED